MAICLCGENAQLVRLISQTELLPDVRLTICICELNLGVIEGGERKALGKDLLTIPIKVFERDLDPRQSSRLAFLRSSLSL